MPLPLTPGRAAFAALALSTLVPLAHVHAQRTDAPVVRRLPASTRTLALGGGQPIAQDAEALLGGPALLNWSRGASALISV